MAIFTLYLTLTLVKQASIYIYILYNELANVDKILIIFVYKQKKLKISSFTRIYS